MYKRQVEHLAADGEVRQHPDGTVTLQRADAHLQPVSYTHLDVYKRQVAVNSEGKTVETTRNLKEALQSAQQRPTGEQKQQQELSLIHI